MQSTAEQKFLVPLFSKSGGFEGITVLFKKGEMEHGHRSIDEDFGRTKTGRRF